MARMISMLACCALALAGCAGNGEVLPIQIQGPQVESAEGGKPGETLTVAVRPFEDLRSDSERLGTRIDFWGGESAFQLADGQAGERVAQMLVDFLKAKGWGTELVSPSAEVPDAAVLLSGRIQTLSVDVEGMFGYSAIAARSEVAIQALNRADGSIVRMTLKGLGSQEEFWFDAEDAQGLLNGVLTKSFERLIATTKVENNSLRPQ